MATHHITAHPDLNGWQITNPEGQQTAYTSGTHHDALDDAFNRLCTTGDHIVFTSPDKE